ncbi:class II aldolase/adducin family protein [Actinomadura rudentiformis]|uniref:class II aldolase/adducin family protein n=1 Tax=Actinomadura rudentiformis TaxID=359158 RepID=UPI001CEF9927|nr:class II aldolase/adducin family protein [Actinomadura rudentiformis]
MRRDIALACRVLAFHGLAADVLGHVSVRAGTGRMLIRCRGPRESGLLFTTPEDVHLVDLDGPYDALPGGYAVPSELPIHAETLRHRPDVTAVVHAHPPAVVAADLAGLRLRPIVGAFNIPAMRLAAGGIPVYPRGVLIRRTDLAKEMLSAMGPAPVCVLRGHGVTTTGATIAQAVVRALNLEALARITLDAAQAGAAQAGGAVPPDMPAADIAELPDLGSTLNEESVWRHHLARLAHAGLSL